MTKFIKDLLTFILSSILGITGCVLYVAFYGLMIILSLFLAIKILTWIF